MILAVPGLENCFFYILLPPRPFCRVISFSCTFKGIRKKIKNNAFVDIANTKSIIINLKNVICFYKFTLELNKISIEKKIDIKISIWPAISIPYSASLLNLTKKSIKIKTILYLFLYLKIIDNILLNLNLYKNYLIINK